jgi:ComEC/Rec2-related protein
MSEFKFKKIFNLPNLFLVFVATLVIWNSILTSDALQKKQDILNNKNLKIRILDQKTTPFGTKTYTVWTKNSLWELENADFNYQIGQEYTISGNLQKFAFSSTESQKNYDVSLGISGKIKTKETLQKNLNCDWLCLSLKQNNRINQNIETYYQNLACRDLKIITQIFAANSSCKDIGALSVGLVLGGTQGFSKETKQNFRNLGLTHLVAVSGFQVILLINFLEQILIQLNLPRKWRFIIFLLGIFILLMLVGPQPPVLRSSFSVFLSYFVLTFLGRKLESFRILVYSGLIMLLINPLYLFSVSFQLSFLASLGLVLLLGQIEQAASNQFNFWKNLSSQFLENFWGSFASFLFTLPIIIKLSGGFSPLSILTNTIILPIIPLITFSNLLGLIPFLGEIFIIPAIFGQSLLIFLTTEIGSNLKLLGFSAFNFWESLVYYIVLILIILIFKILKNKKSTETFI